MASLHFAAISQCTACHWAIWCSIADSFNFSSSQARFFATSTALAFSASALSSLVLLPFVKSARTFFLLKACSSANLAFFTPSCRWSSSKAAESPCKTCS